MFAKWNIHQQHNNDILSTQNWKQSQADPFLAQKVAIIAKYFYVDNVDEIFHPHPESPWKIKENISARLFSLQFFHAGGAS